MNTTRKNFHGRRRHRRGHQRWSIPAVNAIPKLVHHVFFWLKNPDSKEDLARLLQGLRTLSKIETVRASHFGVPASTEKRDVVDNSYSASEILFFDDTAGQKTYQDTPSTSSSSPTARTCGRRSSFTTRSPAESSALTVTSGPSNSTGTFQDAHRLPIVAR
jgi:hypothetical protein